MKYLFPLLLLVTGCTQIDTGNVGVEATLGQVKPGDMSPGLYFTLFKTVHEVTTKAVPLQLYNMRPKSKDNLP